MKKYALHIDFIRHVKDTPICEICLVKETLFTYLSELLDTCNLLPLLMSKYASRLKGYFIIKLCDSKVKLPIYCC